MKKLIIYLKKINIPKYSILYFWAFIVTIVSIIYVDDFDTSIYKGFLSILIPFLFLLLSDFLKSFKDESITYSDEQRLLLKKREYLDSILNTLKLDIDKELKVSLENGEVEEANELIEDKINALNKLVETVTGNNTKSLRGTDISSVSAFYESTNSRIRTEIERIKLNANINMIIGVGASIVAIYLLYSTIQNHKIELLEIIPRATISILIEAFAFFFFSQYRKQQEEIKYWNNEKTNLDIKIFALSIAIDDSEIGTKDYMRNLITDLIKTERNIFGTTTQPKEDKPKEGQDDKKLYEDIFSKIKDLADLLPKK